MRNDERYRQKPMSNQLEIFGLGADGEQDMAEARYPHLRHAFNKHRSKSDGFVDE